MPDQTEDAIRILLLHAPGRAKPREQTFRRDQILIGRSDPSRSGHAPDLSLEEDRQASRIHARLRARGGRWTIEDLGSKCGTHVRGLRIESQRPQAVSPGTPIQTGRTVWTFFPARWFYIMHEGVACYGAFTDTLNFAAFHCGVPLVGALTACNTGLSRSVPFRLGLEAADISEVWEQEIPGLDPGIPIRLGVPNLRLHVERLRNMTEPSTTRLIANIDGMTQVSAGREMTLLGFWDWSYKPSARKTIAAFVSPRNPMVERVVLESRSCLAEVTGEDSFGAVLRSGREDTEACVLESLYRNFLVNHEVHWLPPDANGSKEAGKVCQKIRPPHRIFPGGFTREAQGTCLDLAVFLAGCLENIGLCPVVVFTGEGEDAPHHALGGCWVGTVPGDQPVVTDRQALRREVDEEHLLLVECTGFAHGAGERLAFDQARKRAEKQLHEAAWLCLVDIKALRPPFGTITPMDSPLEPEVGRAFEEAKGLAMAKKRELVETTHLFYGLLAARGEVIRWLAEKAAFDSEALRRKMEEMIPTRAFQGEPLFSRNYHECRRFAEDLAWHSQVPSVGEQDLLWALLMKGMNSFKLRQILKTAGVDHDKLSDHLEEKFPCPKLGFSSFSVSSGPED